jgi:ADP-heptose:LPS heptosyltransferase
MRGHKNFLVVWNRGLGDIPLGLYAFMRRMRQHIPEATVTFLTRPELGEAFHLLEGVQVITAPSLKREDGIPAIPVIRGMLESMGIPCTTYDAILVNIDPTGELRDTWGSLIPRLTWKDEYDALWRRFSFVESLFYIGAHVNTETQSFYGYRKDWPRENWERLFDRICSSHPDVRVILFGVKKTDRFAHPSLIDLRGETSLLEMLSVIKNCCRILIAPDSGVLSITYYLDVNFPITVISLWADPKQGVLKQGVPSPNPGLNHIPLIGSGNDVSRINADEILSIMDSLHQRIHLS